MINKDSNIPIIEFSGGMNQHISPFLLKPNTAVYLENVDVSTGKLVPLKQDSLISYINAKKFKYYDDDYITFDYNIYANIFNKKLYLTDGTIYKDKNTYLKYDSTPPVLLPVDSTKQVHYDFAIEFKDVDGNIVRTPWIEFRGEHHFNSADVSTHSDDIKTIFDFKDIVTSSNIVEIYDSSRDINYSLKLDLEDSDTYIVLRSCQRGLSGGSITCINEKLIYKGKNTSYTKEYLSDEYPDLPYVAEDTNLKLQRDNAYLSELPSSTYVVTYYNEEFDLETPPSNKVSFGKVSNNELTYGVMTGWSVRIYKLTDDGLDDFTLIDTTTSPTYLDTSTTRLVAGNHILDSYNNYSIPDSVTHAVMYKGLHIAIVENKVYYSKRGYPEYFPKENFIIFEEDLEGIGVIQSGLVIFSKNKSWIIAGEDETNFFVYPLSYEVGCVSRDSITYYKNTLIWASYDGISTTTGSVVENLTKNHLGYLTLDESIVAGVWNERVFISGINNKTLIIDFRFDIKFYYIDSTYSYLEVVKSKLHGIRKDYNELVEVFGSNENREFTYLSPKFSIPTFISIPKYSKEFILTAQKDSELRVQLFIDDIISYIETTNSILNNIDNFDIIKYKINKKQYRVVQIEIKSKGEVYEYIFS